MQHSWVLQPWRIARLLLHNTKAGKKSCVVQLRLILRFNMTLIMRQAFLFILPFIFQIDTQQSNDTFAINKVNVICGIKLMKKSALIKSTEQMSRLNYAGHGA